MQQNWSAVCLASARRTNWNSRRAFSWQPQLQRRYTDLSHASLVVSLTFIGTQQQEEQDRKAARLKEMEARRQAVLQKKVEEGKVKAGEEEKKVKEDVERRKKEREENTSKRPLVRTDSKVSF